MEQAVDDLSQKLDRVGVGEPSSPEPTASEGNFFGIAENETKQAHPSTKKPCAEPTPTDSESQSTPSQDQASMAVDSSSSGQAVLTVANNSDATSAPAVTITAGETGETNPSPAVRYFTYQQEKVTGNQDTPAFDWYVTSPEGQTTRRYIT